MSREDEIRARLDAATMDEGGWDPYPLQIGGVMVECEGTNADADLIAHAPDDLRWLLAEVERLTQERDELFQHRAILRALLDALALERSGLDPDRTRPTP